MKKELHESRVIDSISKDESFLLPKQNESVGFRNNDSFINKTNQSIENVKVVKKKVGKNTKSQKSK